MEAESEILESQGARHASIPVRLPSHLNSASPSLKRTPGAAASQSLTPKILLSVLLPSFVYLNSERERPAAMAGGGVSKELGHTLLQAKCASKTIRHNRDLLLQFQIHLQKDNDERRRRRGGERGIDVDELVYVTGIEAGARYLGSGQRSSALLLAGHGVPCPLLSAVHSNPTAAGLRSPRTSARKVADLEKKLWLCSGWY
ncbi:hypothetical protein BRADI_4g22041v3 [Brachypodium distachyon]|uniref:Uncharacterized protein n=1 Tax=Brachypodium distachyon TaxID=15368 RepID=A0A0Q3H636_BRADI|nr:hypothetical protein BRADI_4g22041v3 [Brachypodium distachyon]